MSQCVDQEIMLNSLKIVEFYVSEFSLPSHWFLKNKFFFTICQQNFHNKEENLNATKNRESCE